MEKIARCVQTIKGVPICLDVEDIDESDDVANDQGRQYNKDIGPESFAGGGVVGTRRQRKPHGGYDETQGSRNVIQKPIQFRVGSNPARQQPRGRVAPG